MAHLHFSNVLQPLAPPLPPPAPAFKRLSRKEFDAEFAARVERALIGVPAPANTTTLTEKPATETITLASVAEGVSDHRRILATSLNQLRAATDANRPAALAEAQSALTAASAFYSGILDHVSTNEALPDAENLCLSLSPLHSAIEHLESELI